MRKNCETDYKPFAQLIRDRIAKYGDRTALKFQEKRRGPWLPISWNEMGKKIDAVAKSLLARGVKVGDKIAIFSQNMPEWSLADFGILSIRAVTVPVYATSTGKQAEYILQDSGVKHIFVDSQEQYEKIVEILPDNPQISQIVVFDKKAKLYNNGISLHFEDFINEKQDEYEGELKTRLAEIQKQDLATLIYTSGTTGNPKGVMLDQDNIEAQLWSHDQFLDANEDDVSLAFLPLSHIFERAWVFYALHAGMTICYLSDPREVAAAMKEVRPTVMCSVPRLYEKVYATIQAGLEKASPVKQKLFSWAVSTGKLHRKASLKGKANPLLSLRYKLARKLVLGKVMDALGGRLRFSPCGGAKLSSEINEFFHSIGLHVMCGYGLSETTATLSTYMDTGFAYDTVGKPAPGVEMKIGKDNEILVKGRNVMKGYYNLPEATAEVFTEDGWFRTGDAGYFDEQGDLIITDRIKDLMKTSGGKYIAPQMIETLIGNDHYIQQVAIIGDQRKYVTALIVPAFDALKEWAENRGVSLEPGTDILNDKLVMDFFRERIDRLQNELARFEQVKKFTLMPNEFTIDAGEITPTLKVKRKVILQKYKDIIDRMYD
ncbi:long-chain-fatty-acid--CoA ligase [Fulvitalea axinellae]|uniref:Long-chain-fatty-acid--CoA ligase n=1 Tax=Fulvitalea axinellae TaxID=1182444 RepID=A0AAU9DAV5_9BACT|nr:long-chain-fatty-acid--CoA ligase [Fulvitalea axinellae]